MNDKSSITGSVRVLVVALFAFSLQAATWNKHWEVGDRPELRIHSDDAAIQIEGTGGNGIDAVLTTRGYPIGNDGVRIEEHQHGSVLDLEVRVPHTAFNFGDRSVQLKLKVPRHLRVDIHTGDGSIRLTDLAGNIHAETGDGSVHGDQLDGNLWTRTGDGSVHLSGRFDDLQLHTQDGSVEVNVARDSKLTSGWRIETGDGSVHVAVPGDLAASLELRTGDGHIALDSSLKASNTNRAEHEVRSQLNGGGPTLVVRTGDGSIDVKSN